MSELLKINVNEHTEKKNGLTYLSWAWAWAEVLKVDPAAEWKICAWPPKDEPFLFLPDGSAMVQVSVTIKGQEKGAVLPVMDHRNKAIKNPDAFAINTAIQRCLAKAIAMHGLGLYIYAGEDMPEQVEPEKTKRQIELEELAGYMVECHDEGKDMEAIKVWYSAETWNKDAAEANEERIYVWGLLKPYSKLRSTIKANSPEELAKKAIKETA